MERMRFEDPDKFATYQENKRADALRRALATSADPALLDKKRERGRIGARRRREEQREFNLLRDLDRLQALGQPDR
ncbi:hypothetical protein [Limnoglobus roseus]|uniref:hypothetical protein n=1 Tax=Limnoglobus roseus TaxID=2598579 RepID=UPI00143DBB96|nr:hypothetical protein [Limnoglobus roseus]